MLMKWKDLEPGDRINLNEDFMVQYDPDQIKDWITEFRNKELIIENISEADIYGSEGHLIIKSRLIDGGDDFLEFQITSDGKFWTGSFLQHDVFKVLGLKNDDQ